MDKEKKRAIHRWLRVHKQQKSRPRPKRRKNNPRSATAPE